MTAPELEAALLRELDVFPAKSALLAVDLTSGRPFVSIRPDSRVVSASTIKVAILFCALDQVQRGKLCLTQSVPVLPEDLRPDSEVFEPGGRPAECTLWEALYWMIVSSDNSATNAVISLLGFDAINAYCASLGLSATCLQRKMLDFNAAAAGRENYTSPADQYRLYSLLFRGALFSGQAQAAALDLLGRSRSFDSLQRYIPDPVPVLHKPGGLDHLNHDAGIFLLKKRPYFVGIFTWDGPALDGESAQKQLIGRLSRQIYTFVKEQEDTL